METFARNRAAPVLIARIDRLDGVELALEC
jgi:hypothetical protein